MSATSATSQLRGTVRSAYLSGALPGGSSGGSGVASGAYLAHFTFGGETGGSIRNPADRSALVGFKVSGGSISVNRIIPLAPERDVVGPMTRYAVDNAVIRDVVGALDPDDIWSPVLPILTDRRPVPEGGFSEALTMATLQGKKIGIIGTYVGMPHPDPGEGATPNTTAVQTITPSILALVQQAKRDLEAAGATVDYVFMPPQVSTTYDRGPSAPVTRLLTAPASTNVAAYSYRGLIEAIVASPGDTYHSIAAKVLETAALPRTNTGGFYISEAVRAAMYNVDPETGEYSPGMAISFGSPEGLEHYAARAEQKNAFEDWLDAEGLDAVVWPMWPNKGPTTGTIIGRDLVNFMFLPSITVPMGVLPYDTDASEPLTMNITGRLYDDINVLAIAYAYEQATKHRYPPPLAPPLSGEVFVYHAKRKGPVDDDCAPVVNIVPSITFPGKKENEIARFSGAVQDASGIERLEVTVDGILIPSSVDRNRWSAALSAAEYAEIVRTATNQVDVMVLAVDRAGNAAADRQTLKLR